MNKISLPKIIAQDNDVWQIVLSVAMASGSIAFLFDYIQNSDCLVLNSFTNRTIGIVVLAAVDASLRTNLYIALILLSIILFFTYFFLGTIISKKIIKNTPVEFEKQILTSLSIVLIGTLFLFYSSQQLVFHNNGKVLLFLILLFIFIILIKSFSYDNKRKALYNLLSDSRIIVLSLIGPVIFLGIYWQLFGGRFIINSQVLYLYLSFWVLLFVTYYLLHRFLKSLSLTDSNVANLTVTSSIPLSLILLSIPVANEIQYAISSSFQISPRTISVLITASLTISSIILMVFLIKKRKFQYNLEKITYNIHLPLFIFSIALFKFHQHSLKYPKFDIFHTGERLISTQQLFSFGRIPFIDLYPTHGLSESIGQILYSLVNGYKPIEPLIWRWISLVLVALLLYFLLKKLGGPIFSALIILFIPIMDIFGKAVTPRQYFYFFCIIPAFTLAYAIKSPNLKRLSMHWVMCLLVLLWRIEIGIPSIVATIFILFFTYLRKFLKGEEGLKAELRSLLYSAFFVLVPCLTLFLFLVHIADESVTNIIIQNIQLVKFQALIAARELLYADFSYLVLFQYIIVPLISIFYIIYFIYYIILKEEKFSDGQYMLLFLAVFSLILSLRSTQRHCLLEAYNAYQFVFLFLCIPFYLRIRRPHYSQLFFTCLLAAYLPLFPSYTTLLKADNMFEFTDWKGKEPRVVFADHYKYKDITKFLSENLGERETFFDFSNAPLLFVLSDKEFIPYLVPNGFYSSEIVQMDIVKKLSEAYRNRELPYVIFKQASVFRSVPNEIRSYRISEFIYRNFKPFGNMGKFQIWTAKYKSHNNLIKSIRYLELSPNRIKMHNMKKLKGNGIIVDGGHDDPYFYNFARFQDVKKPPYRNTFLKIEYRCSKEGKLAFYFRFDGPRFVSQTVYKLKIANCLSEITVPIPDNLHQLTNIRIDPPDSSVFQIEKAAILETNSTLRPVGKIGQNFDLQKLPYIWGTYDPKEATSKSTLLQKLKPSHLKIGKGGKATFHFAPEFDKSSGNYIHMKIKSPKAAHVSIRYGINSTSSIEFDTIPGASFEDYLIRISSQWSWMSEPVDEITIMTTENILINEISIRKGD